MHYRKIETTVQPDGKVSKLDLGTVAADRFDHDKLWERQRQADIARAGRHTGSHIFTVEDTDCNIVTVYTNGKVRILAYVPQEGN